MNRLLVAVIIAIVAGVIFSIPLLSEHFASAGDIKKIQFTQTVTSSPDPGLGHGSEQLAMILAPNNGTIYSGTLTYTASEPVQVVVLHQIDKSDSKGQPVWTVDNNTIYAETTIDSDSNGGTLDFAGSAIGLHSTNSSQFTVTASIDGWIRGTTPVLFENATQTMPINGVKLSRAEIPVNIPLREGLFEGEPVYYIITDSSDSTEASQLSSKNWTIQQSPLLAQAPEKLLGRVYVFTNGMSGNGTDGFQDDVLSETPSNSTYTPINLVVHATWTAGRTPLVLNSTQEILSENATGKLTLTTTNTIINMPEIVWPGGQMTVRDDQELSDQPAYTGGQVMKIDNASNQVTFVAHRGWGPDGKTVYYIVTSGTPAGPAKMMGAANTPSLSMLFQVGRNLYHFSNGINGAGPFGFQEGISDSQPGDASYSPICNVSIVAWNDPAAARLLENIDDINFEKSQGRITIQTALAYNDNYTLDCPIVEIPKNNS